MQPISSTPRCTPFHLPKAGLLTAAVAAASLLPTSLGWAQTVGITEAPEYLIERSNTIDLVLEDSVGRNPHEAELAGAPDDPSFGFHLRGRDKNGVNPRFNAALGWGQVYQAAGTRPVDNVSVQVRNMDLAVYDYSSNRWFQVREDEEIGGLYFLESFRGDISGASDRVTYGGDTIEAPVFPPDLYRSVERDFGEGVNFHFFHERRGEIDIQRDQEFLSNFEARLVLTDPNGPDNLAEAQVLMGAGADIWREVTTDGFDPEFRDHFDVGIGRHRFLTTDWQPFNMGTFDENELRSLGLLDRPGDFNRDARTDEDDLDPFVQVFRDSLLNAAVDSAAVQVADIDNNGLLDDVDLRLFADELDNMDLATLRELVAVPEPTSVVVLGVVGALMLRRRRA